MKNKEEWVLDDVADLFWLPVAKIMELVRFHGLPTNADLKDPRFPFHQLKQWTDRNRLLIKKLRDEVAGQKTDDRYPKAVIEWLAMGAACGYEPVERKKPSNAENYTDTEWNMTESAPLGNLDCWALGICHDDQLSRIGIRTEFAMIDAMLFPDGGGIIIDFGKNREFMVNWAMNNAHVQPGWSYSLFDRTWLVGTPGVLTPDVQRVLIGAALAMIFEAAKMLGLRYSVRLFQIAKLLFSEKTSYHFYKETGRLGPYGHPALEKDKFKSADCDRRFADLVKNMGPSNERAALEWCEKKFDQLRAVLPESMPKGRPLRGVAKTAWEGHGDLSQKFGP